MKQRHFEQQDVSNTEWISRRKARHVLTKSRAFSFGRSPRTRTKWQASVTKEASLRTISCSGKLNAFNSGTQDKRHETYKTDLSEKRDFNNEILRWQTKWSHSTDKKTSDTHRDSTLQHANPDLYPNVVTIITILLTMGVSTATPERSFSTMHRVKTYLRSTMKVERLAALALMHAYRDIPIYLCRSRDSRIFRQKEQTSSFRFFLSSTKISDTFATNVSIVRTLRCCCCWPQP